MTDHRRLERLLELRRHEEQCRTVELAMARKSATDAESALELLRAQRRDLERGMLDGTNDSIGQIKTVRLLIEQVDQSLQNARTISALAQGVVAEKVEAVHKASGNREALERVLAPRRAHDEALERLAEQKADDEIAVTRFRTHDEAPS